MPFPIACSCGQRFLAQDHLVGKRVPCPACGTELLIQSPQQPIRRPAAPAQNSAIGTVTVTCACGRSYQAGSDLAGRTVRCTACGHVLQVPGAAPAAWNASSWEAASTPTYNFGIPTQPLSTYAPSSGPYAPARPAKDDGNRTVTIVLGIAIAVSLLAIVLGVVFTVLSSGDPQVAQNAETTGGISSSDQPSGADATDASSGATAAHGTAVTTESGEAVGPSDPATPANASSSTSPSAMPSYNTTPPVAATSSSPYSNGTSTTYGAPAADSNTNDTNTKEVVNTNPSLAEPTARGDFNRSGAVESAERSNSAKVAKSVSLPESLLRWEKQPTRVRAGLRRVQETGLPQMQYSWMCDLLPHLGHQELYDNFNFTLPWSDDANLQLTGEVVPEFLKPGDSRERFEGYPFRNMALSHFAGMSGVEDRRNVVAAQLPRTDPRAGVFGYDDVAEMRDITDGASNSIMVVESGQLAAPWALGGGGTIRGAREPYFDKISGFGSSSGSAPGALAVMADGSVRMISANVSPSVFRAISTIHGGETVDIGTATKPADLK